MIVKQNYDDDDDDTKLDRKSRKMLTIHGQHYPRTETDLFFFLLLLFQKRGRK
jgi:hypothetical protein